jgi:hypothetical protein
MVLKKNFFPGVTAENRWKTGALARVILSTVILAGMLTAGCMQESGSAAVPSGISPGATPAPSLATGAEKPAGDPAVHAQNQTGIRPGQNPSEAPPGMPAGGAPGLPVNGTAPPGMPMNGTAPRGAPPQGGLPVNGTSPAGPPGNPGARPGS